MEVIQPKINEWVDYHSPYRTGVYAAVIRKINPDGTVAIDVYLPGLAVSRRKMDLDPVMHLRAVSYGPQGLARPRS